MLNLLLKTGIISIVLIILSACLGWVLMRVEGPPANRFIISRFMTWFFARVLLSMVLFILSLEMLLQALKIVK